MKLLIIRHGDPDYSIDSLTPNGKKEAEALANYLASKRIDDCYVSPLGRAQDTAAYTLRKIGKTAETLPWLTEFPAAVRFRESPELFRAMPTPWDEEAQPFRIAWDILPSYLYPHEEYLDKLDWRTSEVAKFSDLEEVYDGVANGLDALLAKYGYERNGNLYHVTKSSDKVVALFCHFGVESVMLSHLLGISPFAIWHGFMALPSSVTVVNTEEREQGVACFRVSQFGDLSHLALADLEPSFAGRYCERFEDPTLH